MFIITLHPKTNNSKEELVIEHAIRGKPYSIFRERIQLLRPTDSNSSRTTRSGRTFRFAHNGCQWGIFRLDVYPELFE